MWFNSHGTVGSKYFHRYGKYKLINNNGHAIFDVEGGLQSFSCIMFCYAISVASLIAYFSSLIYVKLFICRLVWFHIYKKSDKQLIITLIKLYIFNIIYVSNITLTFYLAILTYCHHSIIQLLLPIISIYNTTL